MSMFTGVVAAVLLTAASATHAESTARDASYVDAAGEKVMRLSVDVKRPVGEVWAAVSTAEGWKTWAVASAWGDVKPGGVLETSYSATAARGAATNIRNQFLEVVPARALVYRNVQAPTGFKHAAEFSRTTSVLTLTALDAGTTRVEYTGFGYRAEPAYEALYGFFLKGNAWTLDHMKAALETGR